ncbi:MAG: carbon storage regulator [Planctomycetota bacterium]
MLVLSRKMDETIRIGDDVEITVLKIRNNQVRLGIRAPRDVRVLRGELQVTDAPAVGEVDVPPLGRAVDSSVDNPVKTSALTTSNVSTNGEDTAVKHHGRFEPFGAGKISPDRDGGSPKPQNRCDPTPSVFTGRLNPVTGSAKMRKTPLGSFFTAP